MPFDRNDRPQVKVTIPSDSLLVGRLAIHQQTPADTRECSKICNITASRRCVSRLCALCTQSHATAGSEHCRCSAARKALVVQAETSAVNSCKNVFSRCGIQKSNKLINELFSSDLCSSRTRFWAAPMCQEKLSGRADCR